MNQNQNNMLETVDLIKDTFEKTDFPKLTWTTNYYNDYYGWLKLENVADLTKVMEVFKLVYAQSVRTRKTAPLKQNAVPLPIILQ